MEHNKVIEAIRYCYEANPTDEHLDISKIDIATINCDYYVPPGLPRKMFMMELRTILETVWETSDNSFFLEDTVSLIKRYFDCDFFKLHLAEQKDFSNKKQLSYYLNKFSCERLKEFIALIIKARHVGDLFMSNDSSTDFWKTLNDKCMEIDSSVPDMQNPEYGEAIGGRVFYQFDYLSKKTIARFFCEHIDKDIQLAEKVAHAFYAYGDDAAVRLVNAELRRRKM